MIFDKIQAILQQVAVEARETTKQKLKINSLLSLDKLEPKVLDKFKIEAATDIYNMMRDKTSLPHRLLRLEHENKKINYAVVVYDYIIDPGLEGKIFAMKMKDYPKVKDYQVLADATTERERR